MGCGWKVNIEKHENRFADMERGREADVQSGRSEANVAIEKWLVRRAGSR